MQGGFAGEFMLFRLASLVLAEKKESGCSEYKDIEREGACWLREREVREMGLVRAERERGWSGRREGLGEGVVGPNCVSVGQPSPSDAAQPFPVHIQISTSVDYHWPQKIIFHYAWCI